MSLDTYSLAAYPAIRICLLVITGIVFHHYFDIASSIWIYIVIIILVIAVWLIRLYEIRIIAYLFSLILFGYLLSILSVPNSPIESVKYLSSYEWDEMYLVGQVTETRKSSQRTILYLQTESIVSPDSMHIRDKMKIRLSSDWSFDVGDELRAKAILIPISAKRNKHDFDYEAYLMSEGISLQFKAIEVQKIASTSMWINWQRLRNRLSKRADSLFSEPAAPLAKALLIGSKSDMDAEIKQQFSRVGLSHIMAVSGLHVGFIVAPIWVIIPFFNRRLIHKVLLVLLLGIILYSYCGITGFSNSVVRASLMVFVLIVGKLFSKGMNSLNLAALAALFILILDAQQLFNIGFQLSFSAVYIILLILPQLQRLLPDRIQNRWYSFIIMTILVSMVVQIGLVPMQAYYFGEISIVSPVSNALFVPLLGWVIPFSFLIILTYPIFPGIFGIINIPNNYYLEWMMGYSEIMNEQNWIWANLNSPDFLEAIIWLVLILNISHMGVRKVRYKLSIILLSLVLGNQISSSVEGARLKVYFFDVGQGDAALISTPEGHHFLIDAGIWSPSFNSSSTILNHLKKEGISSLDAIFISHAHADHIGGLPDLIEEIDIGVIYDSDFEYDSKLYQTIYEKARQYNVPIAELQAGDRLDFGDGVQVFIYSPSSEISIDDPNEHSIMLEVHYGETEFLFTGDAEHISEKLAETWFHDELKTSLLKVGHHGSRTSTTSDFLSAVNPEVAVVSCGLQNKFRHPHRRTVNLLDEKVPEVYYTALAGGIEAISDGKEIRIQTQLEQNRKQ